MLEIMLEDGNDIQIDEKLTVSEDSTISYPDGNEIDLGTASEDDIIRLKKQYRQWELLEYLPDM